MSGFRTSGTLLSGPRELKEILFKRKGEFIRNLSRKMLGYALGRGLSRADLCVIKDATAALAEHEYRPSALIEEIVMSKPFQYRYVGK